MDLGAICIDCDRFLFYLLINTIEVYRIKNISKSDNFVHELLFMCIQLIRKCFES